MRRRSRAVVVAIACFAAALPVTAVAAGAPPLPASVSALAPTLRVQGGGELTFYGISVYDGWYWSPVRGWPHEGPYALDLHYHRDLDGAKIAQRAIDEITKLGRGTTAERARWATLMTSVFPDVRKGDRITGVHDGRGAVRYYKNGALIGTIDEPGFAQAFFGIWLDPGSSRIDFRQKLLGGQ